MITMVKLKLITVNEFRPLLLLIITLPVPTDAVAFQNARFGHGTGAIFLNNVGCTGNEMKLTECSYSSTVCVYGHSEDAGVQCQGK